MNIKKIRWKIGKKKPVEWDISKLATHSFPLIGPVEVSWTVRFIDSNEIVEHTANMYWQNDELYHLESIPPTDLIHPLLMIGQPILVAGVGYLVEYMEAFTLPPSRINSPFEGEIGFSLTGWAGFRYLVKKV
jgi:hypothetical protein